VGLAPTSATTFTGCCGEFADFEETDRLRLTTKICPGALGPKKPSNEQNGRVNVQIASPCA
jgi:hypothetical protein